MLIFRKVFFVREIRKIKKNVLVGVVAMNPDEKDLENEFHYHQDKIRDILRKYRDLKNPPAS